MYSQSLVAIPRPLILALTLAGVVQKATSSVKIKLWEMKGLSDLIIYWIWNLCWLSREVIIFYRNYLLFGPFNSASGWVYSMTGSKYYVYLMTKTQQTMCVCMYILMHSLYQSCGAGTNMLFDERKSFYSIYNLEFPQQQGRPGPFFFK